MCGLPAHFSELEDPLGERIHWLVDVDTVVVWKAVFRESARLSGMQMEVLRTKTVESNRDAHDHLGCI